MPQPEKNCSPSSVRWALLALSLLIALTQTSAYANHTCCHPTTLTIAVAANFKSTLEQLITEYPNESDMRFKLSSGASGQLYHQILSGAPYDLFFSADEFFIDQLLSHPNALTNSNKQIYAIGRLALWSPLGPLTGQPVKIGIANPTIAPYGKASYYFLQPFMDKKLIHSQQLITAINVSQVYNWVATGNASAGLVSLAHLIQNNIPEAEYTIIHLPKAHEIRQGAIVLQHQQSTQNSLSAAHDFLTFITTEQVRSRIRTLGYETL